jgi:hypothetical protein
MTDAMASGKSAPRASRPNIPDYGLEPVRRATDLLPWKWATDRLKRSRTYLITTTRPDGSPHAMPVWGIWVEASFYFSTGRQSRKARNLAASPRCVVATDCLEEVVILEGTAEEVRGADLLRRLDRSYRAKYKPYRLDPSLGPVFAVRPRLIYGLDEKRFTKKATVWRF